jgi:ornithine cyclodeaminase/alanine dehydrogenase-like protein (mu-crystallin family)
MTFADLPILDATAVEELLPFQTAISSIELALSTGTAPGTTPPRDVLAVGNSDLLIMPSHAGQYFGVKLATVNSLSAQLNVPRIQGIYALFDSRTMSPVALMDAVTLTTIRTAAVSAVAVDRLATENSRRLTVFGTGPQAWSHISAIATVRPLTDISIVGRDSHKVDELVTRCERAGFSAQSWSATDPHIGDIERADIVACCTSATTPLFDSSRLAPHATVVAIGSHSPSAREVDSALVNRATVVVETKESAWREAGDLILAVKEGVTTESAIDGDLSQLVSGLIPIHSDRPRLFKSVGEAWSDVVTATAVFGRLSMDDARPARHPRNQMS